MSQQASVEAAVLDMDAASCQSTSSSIMEQQQSPLVRPPPPHPPPLQKTCEDIMNYENAALQPNNMFMRLLKQDTDPRRGLSSKRLIANKLK